MDRIEKINHICLLFLAGTAFTLVLYATKSVMVPFAFSVFIYSVIAPLLKKIQKKWKVPRPAAIGLALAAVLGFSVITFIFISMSVKGFMMSADLYTEKLQQFSTQFVDLLNLQGINIDADFVKNETRQLLGVAGQLTSGVLNIFGDFILVVIFVLFMIGGSGARMKHNPLLDEIQDKIFQYVTYKSVLSIMTGVLVGVILAAFNIELAFLIAVLTIWLNFIPNFGSLVASALPIPVILVEYGFDWRLVTVLTLVGAIQFIVGNILEPKLLGDSMDLHPVTILFFLVFWGVVWGIPGMFLAIPFTVILKIVLSRIESTKILAEILAGRFA